MGTLGQAYSEAVQLHRDTGDEAAHVASERAEECGRKGDEAGATYWVRVTAFLAHIYGWGTPTVH